jgi:hypothetical protein
MNIFSRYKTADQAVNGMQTLRKKTAGVYPKSQVVSTNSPASRSCCEFILAGFAPFLAPILRLTSGILSSIFWRRYNPDAMSALVKKIMQDLPAGRAPSVLETRFNESDIPRIRELIGSFLVTLKNHTLYPEDHVICRKSVAAVHARLDEFLAERDVLHLDVKEDRFLIEGSVAHQGTPQNDYLPFQLFRDGIQWLEFHQGLTEEELGAFFKLVIQYRTLKEEAEGDLVTALWEAGFPHLSYKKEEILWNAEPLVDFSLFKTGAGETRIEEEGERESSAPVHRIAAPVTDPAFWKITPEEDKTLREMVFEEETRDYTEDVLDVLTIILREQRDPDNFAVILDFLAEEFGYALVQGEFHFALKFLESLDALRQAVASETPWALELLEDFLKRISGPDVLGALEQAWPAVSVMDSDRRESLRRALLWFHPDVVFTLGPLLANTDLPMIEQLLTEIIGVHAERDLRPIAEMLDTAKEAVIRKLIPLLRKMSGQGPSDLLLSLTRHSSNSVCMDAIHALVTRDSQNLRKIFPMIQDSRPPVRSLILEYLGKRRNPLAEELLLHYFEKSGPHLKDRRHLLACYRALGQCGSARSIPFLQDTLLGRDWKLFMGMGNSVHRLGAALALLSMPREKAAKALLEAANRSSFPGIRAAYRQAVEERKQGKEAGR